MGRAGGLGGLGGLGGGGPGLGLFLDPFGRPLPRLTELEVSGLAIRAIEDASSDVEDEPTSALTSSEGLDRSTSVS